MRQTVSRRLTAAALVLGVLVGLYAVAGFLVAPRLVERHLPGYLAERLGGEVSLRAVAINPFLLRLDARDLRVSGGPDTGVAVERLSVDLEWAGPLRRVLALEALHLDGVEARLMRRADGSLEWPARTKAAQPEQPPDEGAAPAVLVKRLTLNRGSLALDDRSRGEPASLAVSGIGLEAEDLGTLPGQAGRYTLRATLPRDGALTAAGRIEAAGRTTEGRLELEGLDAAVLWPFLREDWRLAEPAGRASLSGDYRAAFADEAPSLVVERLALLVSGLRLARPGEAGAPLLEVARAEAQDGRLDLAARSLALPDIRIAGGALQIDRDGEGRLNWQGLAARAEEAPAADPWNLTVGELHVDELALAVEDRADGAPLAYRATASGRISHIARGEDAPIGLEATLALQPAGKLAIQGELAQDLSRASGKLALADLDLRPLQPLLSRHAAVELVSGRFGGETTFAYDAAGRPRLRLEGAVNLADFRVNEAATGDRLLAGRALEAKGSLALAPGALHLEEMEIHEPGAKIEISRERKLNLAQVLAPRPAPADGAAPPPDEAEEAPFETRIRRIGIHGGEVDFADYSLVLPFSTRVQSVSATVLGVGNGRDAPAVIEGEGRIEPYGSAKVSGRLLPSAPSELTDIRVEFDNVEMPPLSPYTATFAGRKVSSGKLWLDLHYKVEDGQLKGENGVVLDNFTLGERVEAPGALDLPLDLAVALLQDDKGRIELAVPVVGDVDDPRFDYRAVVREAVGRTLGRIVTAPFRFLGRIFGGDRADGLAEVDFEPGSDRLSPPEQEDLLRVAAALKERPRLRVTVAGPYDPARDGRALREERVRRTVAAALGRVPAPGEPVGPVDLGDPRTREALDALLAARGAAVPGASGTRNGGAAKDEARRYDAVFDRLVETEPLEESELQLLATQRADRIVGYLREEGGVPAGRVEAQGVQAAGAEKGPVRTELRLDAAMGREPGPASGQPATRGAAASD